MYKLKINVADFTVVDGVFAGKSYRAGETYAEVPPSETCKFEPALKDKGTAADAIPAPIVYSEPDEKIKKAARSRKGKKKIKKEKINI